MQAHGQAGHALAQRRGNPLATGRGLDSGVFAAGALAGARTTTGTASSAIAGPLPLTGLAGSPSEPPAPEQTVPVGQEPGARAFRCQLLQLWGAAAKLAQRSGSPPPAGGTPRATTSRLQGRQGAQRGVARLASGVARTSSNRGVSAWAGGLPRAGAGALRIFSAHPG